MSLKAMAAAAALLAASPALAATLSQTIHFPGASAAQLFDLYATTAGHSAVTGVPAQFFDGNGGAVEGAMAGGSLDAFCFQPDQCALKARVLDIADHGSTKTITLSWWNFGWVAATDPANLTVEGRGSPDSILVLTFRDTLRGAEIQLVQANVPDYAVRIPNPDGTEETGPLSTIVNTHWNLLYWDGFRREASN